MDRVSIPRGAFVALVVGLAVALVAVAFLLGRESLRGDVVAGTPSPQQQAVVMTATSTPQAEFAVKVQPNATPAAAAPPAVPPAVAVAAPPAPVAPRVTVAPAAPPPPAPSTVAPHSPAAVADAATKSRVQSYFRDMDNIQPGALSGDPQSMANDILQGAMSGDTRQLDDLIHKGEASERRARALHPPPPCAGYHQRSVALCGDSVRMLKTMKSAMASGDTTALMSLSARAGQMQTQAQALQQEEEQLKARYR